MSTDPSIQAMLKQLYRRTPHGIRPGLDRIQALLEALGHPEKSLVCIHVAGTNGKGSVCATIESVLRAGGCRTGLYTSPHLVRFNERIRVNGRSVTDEHLARLLARVEPIADQLDRSPGAPRPCTFFELTTAMAFEHFRDEHIDVAVLETGMGGRLDATNVVLPAVAAICDIGLDHQPYLGSTIEAIAAEKAGIIKPGRPVVMSVQAPEARAVIEETARHLRAPLIRAEEVVTIERRRADWKGQELRIQTSDRVLRPVRFPLPGAHQLRNVATAVAVLEQFSALTGVELTEKTWKRGLETVFWPARLQMIEEQPPTLLDSGHNPHAASALASALRELAGKRPIGLIVGMASDKDHVGFFRAVAPVVSRVWTVAIRGDRSTPASVLAEAARAAGCRAEVSALRTARAEARTWALTCDGVLCIAGSLYLAGEVLEEMIGNQDLYEKGTGN